MESSTRSASRSATPATSPPTGGASRDTDCRPAHARLPGRRGGAAGPRRPGRAARDGGQRDPHRQPRPLGGRDERHDRVRRRGATRSPTSRSCPPTGCSPPTRASSASPRRRPASPGCSPTAPATRGGWRACSPATGSRIPRARWRRWAPSSPARPEFTALERRGIRSRPPMTLGRRRVVRVPASTANLGPGLRRDGRGAGAAPGARGARDRRLRRPHRPRRPARPLQPHRPRLRAPAPRRRLRVPHRLPDPAHRRAGLERRGHRRRPDGRRPPVRARRRHAARWPPSSRAIPTTSRPRIDGGFVICDGRRRPPLRAARWAWRRCSSSPTKPVRTAQARAALPDSVPHRRRGRSTSPPRRR